MGNPRELIVNRQINPLLSTLPKWVESYRPLQIEAVRRIVEAFSRVDVVVLDAPTGSGKTLIGETVRRMMKMRALYVCHSRGLQDQFVRDFDYARVLKGRSNYPTERYPERFISAGSMAADHLSADDCTWDGDSCHWCWAKATCPYEKAKHEALSSDLAVINTAYLLAEANTAGRFSKRDLIIADEADTLENELMRYVSVEISERRMQKLDWYPPEKVTVKDSWAEWIDIHLPKLKDEIRSYPETSDDKRVNKERTYLTQLAAKLKYIRDGLDDPESPWVYTGKGSEGSGRVADHNKGRAVSFKPARVDKVANDYLWRHSKKWLMMSATVISSSSMLDSLGWSGGYETISIPSTFPVENRRVFYMPMGSMAAQRKDGTIPKMVSGIIERLDDHPNDRVLIHTVSYKLASDLFYGVLKEYGDESRPLLVYETSADKEKMLGQYIDRARSVLFAPSMDRGVDLPGDLCRVQIIAKIPFPYLGDRQVNARLHSRGGQEWYNVQTIRTLVQMCGRGVRSEKDWAVTYIMDSEFESRVWGRGRSLIPLWFREAVQWRRI
jgi:Rad3-related DNA helicase